MENHDHSALIKLLLDCALACENCAAECLRENDVAPMVRCISIDRDCSDICTQAARLLQRKSEIAHQYLLLCEEICQMCADECAMHEHDHCRQCAAVCRKCAAACHAHHQPITQE